MSLLPAMSITLAHAKQRATRAALRTLISARHPTLACDSTVIWDIPYKSIDELEIGVGVRIMAFCEILVTPHSRFSSKRGRLSLGDNAVIATGVNVRAAGGEILIAAGSVVNTEVPSGEIWGGTPARRLKAVPTRAELGS
jgi:acetyltransferase-like isoleucine patch superfamily enzyme